MIQSINSCVEHTKPRSFLVPSHMRIHLNNPCGTVLRFKYIYMGSWFLAAIAALCMSDVHGDTDDHDKDLANGM